MYIRMQFFYLFLFFDPTKINFQNKIIIYCILPKTILWKCQVNFFFCMYLSSHIFFLHNLESEIFNQKKKKKTKHTQYIYYLINIIRVVWKKFIFILWNIIWTCICSSSDSSSPCSLLLSMDIWFGCGLLCGGDWLAFLCYTEFLYFWI